MPMASPKMPLRSGLRVRRNATTLALTLATIRTASEVAFAQTAKHYEVAYDPRFIDKLYRADYAAIGTDEAAMASCLFSFRVRCEQLQVRRRR